MDDFDKNIYYAVKCLHFTNKGNFPLLRNWSSKRRKEKDSKVVSVVNFEIHEFFMCAKCNDCRKLLTEWFDAVSERTMHKIKVDNYGLQVCVYYLVETWVNQNHIRKSCWVNDELGVPVCDGGRLDQMIDVSFQKTK